MKATRDLKNVVKKIKILTFLEIYYCLCLILWYCGEFKEHVKCSQFCVTKVAFETTNVLVHSKNCEKFKILQISYRNMLYYYSALK